MYEKKPHLVELEKRRGAHRLLHQVSTLDSGVVPSHPLREPVARQNTCHVPPATIPVTAPNFPYQIKVNGRRPSLKRSPDPAVCARVCRRK